MRGQTTLDFAIGISIFIAVVLFTFGFVPTLLDPFDASAEERPVQAERLADNLSQGMLGSSDNPHVLDRYCTVEFFNSTSPNSCTFQGTDLNDRLGLNFGTNANVTIRQGEKLLCWNSDSSDPIFGSVTDPGVTTNCDSSASSTDIMFKAGEEPRSDLDTTVSAQRIVSVAGERAILRVVVW